MKLFTRNQRLLIKKHNYLFGGILITLFLTLTLYIYKPMNILIYWFCIINLVTLFVYALDKRFANQEKWRIPERDLLSLSLIGGSLGALFAINKLRHKSKKQSYQVKLGMILLIQIILITLFILFVY